MLEEIVGGGKEHFLRAVPLGITMNSHYVRTIAQFIWDSNPEGKFNNRRNSPERKPTRAMSSRYGPDTSNELCVDKRSSMISTDCIVIGAGFAGAATAYHLTRLGVTDILLLEREAMPGFHSSGRNAAMIRQCVPDSALAQLTRDGAAFLRSLPSDWPVPVQFKQNGSLLLGSGKGWEKLRHDTEIGLSLDVEVSLWTPEQAKKHVP